MHGWNVISAHRAQPQRRAHTLASLLRCSPAPRPVPVRSRYDLRAPRRGPGGKPSTLSDARRLRDNDSQKRQTGAHHLKIALTYTAYAEHANAPRITPPLPGAIRLGIRIAVRRGGGHRGWGHPHLVWMPGSLAATRCPPVRAAVLRDAVPRPRSLEWGLMCHSR